MKRTIKLKESELKRMIAESVKRVLNEGYLYTKDIDITDLKISGYWTEDGYAEWEAIVDGWYVFRGTYDGHDCELDEIFSGVGGHGAGQLDIDDEAVEWFDENLSERIASWIDNFAENKTYDEEY